MLGHLGGVCLIGMLLVREKTFVVGLTLLYTAIAVVATFGVV